MDASANSPAQAAPKKTEEAEIIKSPLMYIPITGSDYAIMTFLDTGSSKPDITIKPSTGEKKTLKASNKKLWLKVSGLSAIQGYEKSYSIEGVESKQSKFGLPPVLPKNPRFCQRELDELPSNHINLKFKPNEEHSYEAVKTIPNLGIEYIIYTIKGQYIGTNNLTIKSGSSESKVKIEIAHPDEIGRYSNINDANTAKNLVIVFRYVILKSDNVSPWTYMNIFTDQYANNQDKLGTVNWSWEQILNKQSALLIFSKLGKENLHSVAHAKLSLYQFVVFAYNTQIAALTGEEFSKYYSIIKLMDPGISMQKIAQRTGSGFGLLRYINIDKKAKTTATTTQTNDKEGFYFPREFIGAFTKIIKEGTEKKRLVDFKLLNGFVSKAYSFGGLLSRYIRDGETNKNAWFYAFKNEQEHTHTVKGIVEPTNSEEYCTFSYKDLNTTWTAEWKINTLGSKSWSGRVIDNKSLFIEK